MKNALKTIGVCVVTALVLALEAVFWLAKMFVAGLIVACLVLLLCLGIFHVMNAIDPLPKGNPHSTCCPKVCK